MPAVAPTDVTVHISLPRQLWVADTFGYADDYEKHDQIVGRFIREAVDEGIASLRTRQQGNLRPKHVEITLTDSAVAEVE